MSSQPEINGRDLAGSRDFVVVRPPLERCRMFPERDWTRLHTRVNAVRGGKWYDFLIEQICGVFIGAGLGTAVTTFLSGGTTGATGAAATAGSNTTAWVIAGALFLIGVAFACSRKGKIDNSKQVIGDIIDEMDHVWNGLAKPEAEGDANRGNPQ